MKHKIITFLAFIFLSVGLAGIFSQGRAGADAFCFIKNPPAVKPIPQSCNQIKNQGTNPEIIVDNKCYIDVSKGNTKYKWEETSCGSPGTGNTLEYQPAAIDCKEDVIDRSNCGIVNYLVLAINLLSALVGLVVVAVIIVAGIQFSSAGNDPQKIAAAKGRVVNALLALVVFIFMYAFLQWVVPGGLF